jgi:hypothetical protein
VDLQAACKRIAELGNSKPTEAARKEVESAPQSKWEGVQVTAARTLSAWGDRNSLDLIRELLAQLSRKPAHWASAGALANSLAPHLGESDIQWVIDTCSRAKPKNRFSLVVMFFRLPPKPTLAALEGCLTRGGHDPRWIRHTIMLVQKNSPQPLR